MSRVLLQMITKKDRVFYEQLKDEWLRLATVPADLCVYNSTNGQKYQRLN